MADIENDDWAVAVVGMACRFPGARNLREFWEVLAGGHETIRDLTDEELRIHELDFDEVSSDPAYVRRRGVLEDADQFDAAFFGITPREAALLDPQHRVWLETTWDALEDAGLAPAKFAGKIGVFAGAYLNNYLVYNLCRDREYIERLVRFRSADAFLSLISNDKDYIPTRTSYKLNLTGPSVNVQTACSTSLVAVCQAVGSLLHHESDACIAGGVCIPSPQIKGYLHQEGGMASADGHCRPFDAAASGTVFSSGAGAVVLKRLDDAVADGDPIRAVIKGVAINNDGSNKVSFTAPSVDGQAEVITMALAMAGIEPEAVSYVEAHGTATPLGDPIEIAGLTKAFRRMGATGTGFCGVGSVKSNVGHLDAAAGVAGLIKTVLAMQHRTLPPTLHYTAANPEIDFAASPFYVVDARVDWAGTGGPLRAGVSSFGVGGTNAHVVLEEAPVVPAPQPPARPGWEILPLSARSEAALDQRCRDLHEALSRSEGASLASVALTLQEGRADWEHRRALVARSPAEAIEALSGRAPGLSTAGRSERRLRNVVFLFPGQGAQHPGMGAELFETEPVFRGVVERCAELLLPILGSDLREVLYPADADFDSAARRLRETSVAQPAIFAIELATAELWRSFGLIPSAMIGHSVGEYAAACMAGVMRLEDAIEIIAERARLMNAQPPGSMLSVHLTVEELAASLRDERLAIAAVNAPRSAVVSGPDDAVAELARRLRLDGVEVSELHTSHAYHSSMMDPVLEPFAAAFDGVELSAPAIPFVSCVTGDWIDPPGARDPQYWVGQVRATVRFRDAIERAAPEADALLEVGPGRTLATLAKQCPAAASLPSVASLPHVHESVPARGAVLRAAGALWAHGLDVDWSAFRRHGGRRVALPTYPWERQRYWIDPPALRGGEAAVLPDVVPGELVRGTAAPDEAVPGAVAPGAVAPGEVLADAVATGDAGDGEVVARDVLLGEVGAMLAELSGVQLGPDATCATFLELGFDSLFLTQMSAEIGSRFGVRIGFRKLFEAISTPELLAAHLSDNLDADRLAALTPPAPAAPLPSSGPASSTPPAGQTPVASHAAEGLVPGTGVPIRDGSASTVEAVIARQLDLMQMQLEALAGRGASGEASALPASTSPATAAATAAEATPEAAQPAPSRGIPRSHPEAVSKPRFVPFKPIEKGRDGGLTAPQREHLDALIGRLGARTERSKRAAQEFRAVQADPRSIANFRTVWKELVYQIVATESRGSRFTDIDGNNYIDITMGFGANLFGHSPDWLQSAVEEQLRRGMAIGPQAELAGEVAQLIVELTGMERVSFCNTGSEAVMGALRLARTVTGRDRIAYFSGSYHGVFDEALARQQIRNGVLATVPGAPGITQNAVDSAIVLDYGDPRSLQILRDCADELAAVLIEPVQSRHPDLVPKDFVGAVRELTEACGAALVFDEVITGFRAHPGGMQALYDVKADLATYGKVIGGGLPFGVIAGASRFMDALDGGRWQFGDDSVPEADVTFFAGTFVRHPLTLAAAKAVLTRLREEGPGLQEGLNKRTERFAEDLNRFFTAAAVPIRIQQYSSWFRFDFPPDLTYAPLLFFHLVDNGVYVREPRQNCFFSTAHTDAEIDAVADAVRAATTELQHAGFFPGSPPEEGLPLTGPQEEICMMSALGEDASCAYNECFEIRLRGPLDRNAFLEAVEIVLRRHDALRMRFDDTAERQRLGVAPAGPAFVDLIALDPEAAGARMEELIGVEQRTPFDLGEGPLVRSRLVALDDEDHLFLCSAHHIVFDGWSSTVFVEDLRDAYNALGRGETPCLKAAESFAAYVRDVAERSVDADLAYWRTLFTEPPARLELPTDRPRPAVRAFEGATAAWTLADEAYAGARHLARAGGSTLYTVLLGTFVALLHRLTGQHDLILGIPIAGQAVDGPRHLVGHCLNTLPLRFRPGAGQPFGEFLRTVRTCLLDAHDHQGVSVGAIVRELKLRRDPARLPLVEVIFNLDRKLPTLDFEGVEATVAESGKASSTFDLFMNLNEVEGDVPSLTINLDYSSALFDRTTVESWIKTYEDLLLHVGRSPETLLSKLPRRPVTAEN